jgi:hypothetical protein
MSISRKGSTSKKVSFSKASLDSSGGSDTPAIINETLPTLATYFLQAEKEAVAALVSSMIFISECPRPFESVTVLEADSSKACGAASASLMSTTNAQQLLSRLRVGTAVIVHLPGQSLSGGELVEAFVVAAGSDSILVNLPERRRTVSVHVAQVLFVQQSCLEFQPYLTEDLDWASLDSSAALEEEEYEAAQVSRSFTSMLVATDFAMQRTLLSTAHLLRVLCYALAPASTRRLSSVDVDCSMLQIIAEMSISLLLCELTDVKHPSINESLELILRALTKFTKYGDVKDGEGENRASARLSSSRVQSATAASNSAGGAQLSPRDQLSTFFAESTYVEFCTAVVEYLLSIGITDRRKTVHKTPEKTPTKK